VAGLSDAWRSHFSWRGEGEIPADERRVLRRFVALADRNGQAVRFWGGGVDRHSVWKEQIAAGVDLINTDRLSELRGVLDRTPGTARAPGPDRWPPALARIEGADGRITAHRGACKFAPENTFAAAQLCAEWGVAFVEIDVRTTRDGVPIVMHDTTVDRTTNGTGRVREMSWDEVSRLDAGSWFGQEFEGEPVPRVDEFVAWARAAGVNLYFDVKEAEPEALLRIVNRHGMRDRVFFWSGDRGWIASLREIDGKIPVKVNLREGESLSDLVAAYSPQIVEFGRRELRRDRVEEAARIGLRTQLYTPDNRPELFRRGLEYGVELFNIDHLDVFRRVQRERLDASG
jgi:glycerophosphoryl diester phosphodiesterase